jgi:hypothetical protein
MFIVYINEHACTRYANTLKKWLEAFVCVQICTFAGLFGSELRSCLMDSPTCFYHDRTGGYLAGMEYFDAGLIMYYVLCGDGRTISVRRVRFMVSSNRLSGAICGG